MRARVSAGMVLLVGFWVNCLSQSRHLWFCLLCRVRPFLTVWVEPQLGQVGMPEFMPSSLPARHYH